MRPGADFTSVLLAFAISFAIALTPVASAQEAEEKPVNPRAPESAFNAHGLKVLWRQKLPRSVEEGAVKTLFPLDDLLVVETTDAQLLLLDPDRGIWTGFTALKGPLVSPPVQTMGSLYAFTPRHLLVLDSRSGRVERTLPSRLCITGKAVPFEDSLLISSHGGRVVRYDSGTALRLWFRYTYGPALGGPVLVGSTVYAAGYKGQVVAADVVEGKELWSWRPAEPAEITSRVAAANGKVFVGDNLGNIYCLDGETGQVLWDYPLGDPVAARPFIAGDSLLVVTFRGSMVCLGTGQAAAVKWRHADAAQVVGGGAASFYVVTHGHSLCKVDRQDGTERWRWPVAEDSAFADNPEQPILYLYSQDGYLAALSEIAAPAEE